MKTKIFVVAIVLVGIVTLFYGCDVKCDGYAPAGAKISWNEYNSVRDVQEYFQYEKTARKHQQDTVWICGYGVLSGHGYESQVAKTGNHIYVPLSDDSNLTGMTGPIICVIGDTVNLNWWKNYREGQMVRIKGFCRAGDPMVGCSYSVAVVDPTLVSIE